jgi:hypothetical protein
MSNGLVQCPQCRAPLMEGIFNQPELQPCPACATRLQVAVFPALYRKTGLGQSAEAIMVEGESSCFYHPQKKAVLPCDGCGRFLCTLCDCPLDGRHYCPACLETGRTKRKIQSLDNRRTLYDSIALSVAVYTLVPFFWYFTVITAPMVIYISLRYWKSPLGLLRRTRIRFIAAIFIALLQITGWVAIILGLTWLHSRHNA